MDNSVAFIYMVSHSTCGVVHAKSIGIFGCFGSTPFHDVGEQVTDEYPKPDQGIATLRTAPPEAIPPDELIGSLRSPCTRLIRQDRLTRFFIPPIKNALNKGPGRFDLIAACKERRITEHTI